MVVWVGTLLIGATGIDWGDEGVAIGLVVLRVQIG